MNEQITVSVETWQRMVDQKRLLDCLMIVGVERWPGYWAALEMMGGRRIAAPVNGPGAGRQCPATTARGIVIGVDSHVVGGD